MQVPQILRPVPFEDHDIFDAATFDAGPDSGLEVEKFRSALEHGRHSLEQLFHQGLSAEQLIPARARFVDSLVTRAWTRAFGELRDDLALLAVGGYGRGELHPGSDIDLMILLPDESTLQQSRESIAAFLTFLWDIGLEVGQSVRTIGDCVREGQADVTVVTNLMETRVLQGDDKLFRAMRVATGPDCMWSPQQFFAAKRAEQLRRHQRFHDTAYNLEPNIKEGPGGLRDIQTVAWVAKRYFGADTLQDLVGHGYLTAAEFDELHQGQNFLWRVRFALHTLAGRREDRLLFDYQGPIATGFGYRDQGHDLAIELFMQRYYRIAMQLWRLNEMLLQLFEEAILGDGQNGASQPVNSRFRTRSGYLEACRDDVFKRSPAALLEVFLIFARHPEIKGLRASTIRLIREHGHLLDERVRSTPRARHLFMELLRQQQGITRALRLMSAYGVLAAYLPEYGRIVGRMQYDLFHAYTVDQHILFVVRNLRRLAVPRFSDELPQCSEVMSRLPKPELAYAAALYHDIGKARGGDHSELGAVDAIRFCEQHGLSAADTRLVGWLVQNHLLMSVTAQKQDIYDLEVVHRFAARVGDRTYLDYLYVLTVADIRGTNPSLWNSWRATLLMDLYHAARAVLRRGLDQPVDREQRIIEVQDQARAALARKGISALRIERVWKQFADDYFLRHSVAEITWNTRAILKKADDGRPLVLTRKDPRGTLVFVYQRNHDMLFATTTGVFDQMGLTVVDARILTTADDHSLDTYIVLDADGTPISERYRVRRIADRLRTALSRAPGAPGPRSTGRTPSRRLKHFATPTQVTFGQDRFHGRTLLELITADRPGLLSRVGRVFVEIGVELHDARIATLGERVEDVFFITDTDNRPFDDPDRQQQIRTALTEQLQEITADPDL